MIIISILIPLAIIFVSDIHLLNDQKLLSTGFILT